MFSSLRKHIGRRPWTVAVAVFLAVTAWMVSGAIDREAAEGNPSAATVGPTTPAVMTRVQTRDLVAETVVRHIDVYGSTAPARIANLSAETSGRVERILAPRGARLSRGAPLLQLDERDRNARIAEARANVSRFEADYRAQQRLRESGFVSETDLTATAAMLEGARAELLRAELDVARMTVHAPFDGVLEERQVEVGDFVSAGDPLLRFVDNTSVIVEGDVAEGQIARIAAGDRAEATLVTGQTVSGTLRYVASVADGSTRTFRVELELPNPDGRIAGGVTAEMRIPAGEVLAHRISPALLALDDDGIVGIKTVNDEGRVEFHVVETVHTTPEGIWVSGLPPVARVIVTGQGFVNAGDRVIAVADEDELGAGPVRLN